MDSFEELENNFLRMFNELGEERAVLLFGLAACEEFQKISKDRARREIAAIANPTIEPSLDDNWQSLWVRGIVSALADRQSQIESSLKDIQSNLKVEYDRHSAAIISESVVKEINRNPKREWLIPILIGVIGNLATAVLGFLLFFVTMAIYFDKEYDEIINFIEQE